MSLPKLRKRLLAGILCAGMIFQSIPMNASAYENEGIVEETPIMETEAEAGETEAGTSMETEPEAAQQDVSDQVLTETKEVETVLDETEDTDQTDITTEAEATESKAEENRLQQDGVVEQADEDNSGEDDDDDDISLIDYTKLSVATEEKYYYYGDNLYIITRLSGCEIPKKVKIWFTIDDTRYEPVMGGVSDSNSIYIDQENEGYYIIRLKKSDLTAASHSIEVKLTRDTAAVKDSELITRKANFTVVEQEIFLEQTPYYMGASDDNVDITIFSTENDIKQIELSNNGEKVATSPEGNSFEKVTADPRYTGICKDYEFPNEILAETDDALLYKSVWTLTNLKNAIELGNYNLNLVFDGGGTMNVSGAVTITSEAVVTNCTVAVDYDNTDSYAYLFIQGSGFDPERVTYNFKRESASGSSLNSTLISAKEVSSGYIVKFEKKGDWPQAGETIYVSLRGNNIRFSKSEFTAIVESGIYYAEYNPVLKAVEVGVTLDLNNKKTQFSLFNKEGETIDVFTPENLTDTLIYLTPKTTLTVGTWCVKMEVSGILLPYEKEFTVDEQDVDDSKWDAPKVVSKNAERHYFYYYCEEAGLTNSDVSAIITGEGVSREAVVSTEEWLREDTGIGTSIQIVIPTQKLEIGSYTVTIYKNTSDGNKSFIDSHNFEIVAATNAQFILDEYSISWVDDDTMQVYIKTPNCSEEDMFDIKLTTTSGREVEDLTAVITNRYADSVYMAVTGLKRTDAFRDYYVLLTHSNKSFENSGYPIRMSDKTPYYADKEKGELKTILFNRGMPIKVTANNRVVGINLQYMALPATVKIYAPNDTETLATLQITAATEDDFYYFTKAFYDSLPNKYTLYDMVITDADGWGRTYPGVTIGYRGEIVESDFKVSLSKDILFLDSEGEDTAVITVTQNKQKPSFETTHDDDIVKITVDPDDPNRAILTAVDTGVTIVTVFADGMEKNFIITVTVSVNKIVMDASDQNMWVGDTLEVKVDMLLANEQPSEDPTHNVTFTSSDPSVLYVKQLTATTASITAMSPGTATLRATLDGTTHTASMVVTITGVFSLTQKWQLISEAGVCSYIENVDRSLDYCELPEGWEWQDGSVKLSADDDIPQYFWATYSQEGYESFSARLPVAVTRITGINIDGKNLINRGKQETYSVTYDYVGRDITWEGIAKRLSVNCAKVTGGDIAEVTSVDKEQIVVTAKEDTEGGTAVFRFTLSIDNGTIEGSDMLAETFSVTVPSVDCVDNIVLTPIQGGGQEFNFVEESKLVELNVNDVKAADGKYQLSIALEATINGVPARNIGFEWKSSDESVAAFTYDKTTGKPETDKYGNVVLTIKSVGIAEVTAVATDPGAFTGTLTINVMDYEPVLESTVITINKYSTSGTQFALQEQNGNTITRINVLEQNEQSRNFSVSLPQNGIATMTINANAPAKSYDKKTTSKAVLELRTEKGGSYQYDITVITEVTQPTAAVKLKSKANLFYTNATAVYTVSSNYEIDNISDVSTQYSAQFSSKYDASAKTITFSATGLDNETIDQFTAKNSPRLEKTLRVSFKGYSQTYDITVKIGTENKKENLSVESLTLCPGITKGSVNVLNSKTKEPITSASVAVSKYVSGLDVSTIIDSDGGMDILYTGSKNASYAVDIRAQNWTQSVTAKGKIKYVKSPEQLSLALGQKQLTLNTAVKADPSIIQRKSLSSITKEEREKISFIPLSIGGGDIQIEDIDYDGTAAELIYKEILCCKFYDDEIRLGLNKESQSAIKTGSYKLNLYATIAIGDQSIQIKKATLTIKIVDEKSAKVTMSSAKGKINLIERSTTSVVYTPKVSGIESSISAVVVTGDNQKFFAASYTDQKIEIKAKSNVEGMSSKTTYTVSLLVTLENGYQLTTSVKIKPINKVPKIVLTPSSGNLYRMNDNRFVTTVSFKNSDLTTSSISSITLDTSDATIAKYFSLSMGKNTDNTFNGTLRFALSGGKLTLKKGKYKLKCQVDFKDADADVKPTTINVVITVK